MKNSTDHSKEIASENEFATKRALAYLCQKIPGFKECSTPDRLNHLIGLGLSMETAKTVETLFGMSSNTTHGFFNDQFDPQSCPIPWRPNVTAPVFYGYQDITYIPRPDLMFAGGDVFDPRFLKKENVRIFYPSLSPIPENASFLLGCGQYPLVVFLHGQCQRDPQGVYKFWHHIPAQIARSGYVVVVPQLGSPHWQDNFHIELMEKMISWFRNRWNFRNQLADSVGIVGHSNGGLLGGRLAQRMRCAAYVSLSAGWGGTFNSPFPEGHPLPSLHTPSMFTWGTHESTEAILDGSNANLFDMVNAPKYTISFEGAQHYDYIRANSGSRCGQETTDEIFNDVGLFTADFITLFLTKFMPPPGANIQIDSGLGYTLTAPLSPEQQSFLVGHLMGIQLLFGTALNFKLSWYLDNGETGEFGLE